MNRISAAARNAAAFSPSVALERGNYRIRTASHPKAPDIPRLRPSKQLARKNTHMASVLVLLVLCCLSCFFLAYYLFSTRYFVATLQRQPATNRTPVIDTKLTRSSSSLRDSLCHNEKFLTYLPHSGFHNQRIAFENALVLSNLLNRTLLAPPILLGEPIAYHPFDVLQRYLATSSKIGLNHCRSADQAGSPLSPECFGYGDYTNMLWDSLANLSEIRRWQPIVMRSDMSHVWLQKYLCVDLSQQYYLRDTSKYHYRFVDTPQGKESLHRYEETVLIDSLLSHEETLLHLGSLFGSSRLRLLKRDHRKLRESIRSSMIFVHPTLVQIADRIQSSIGHRYVGVHLRVADGTFEDRFGNSTATVQMWNEVIQTGFDYSQDDARTLEAVIWGGSTFHLDRGENIEHGLRCRGQLYSDPFWQRLHTPLYIATDARHPTSHPAVVPFLRTFPCAVFLNDYENEMAPLDSLMNPLDAVMLKPFMIPFLDAMVLSRASWVVGTNGSTFSQFVLDVLWRKYHGMAIVSRG